MTERKVRASILDDDAAMGRADSEGMLGFVAAFSDQVAEGWRLSRELELPWGTPKSVAVLGMGGSAIGGDLVRGIWGDRITVPVEVVRGYDLPAWVGPETLVVASSKSGTTEETISSLEQALSRRCPVVVVSTGGALKTVAEAAGLPFVTFPAKGAPRAAVGYSLAILAGVLERAGVLALGDAEIEQGVADARGMAARCEPGVGTVDNLAKQLAWALVDRFVMISGSGHLAPVARRWKAQLNENAKAIATFEELPEAAHNAIVGLEQPESLRDHLHLVMLRGAAEHPRNALLAEIMTEVTETAMVSSSVVETEGSDKLGEALSAVVIGDYVSVYVAFMYAVDPSPVIAIDHIKERLGVVDEAPTQ
jgi:glucose/mannose-6-phosphate isomerase